MIHWHQFYSIVSSVLNVDDKPYSFRPYVKDDVPFIHSSWARSYYKGGEYNRFLAPDEFHSFHRPIIERFFERPNATVIVCASKEDVSHILAWVAVEQLGSGLIIHYIYVKQAFKKEGIAGELLKMVAPKGQVVASHMTSIVKTINKESKNYKNLNYLPHLV